MYRRYSSVNREGMNYNQKKHTRIRDVVILLLLAGLIALAVFSIPAMRQQSEERSLFIKKMLSECNEAIKRVENLSRNAGADSAQILARIRSHVHAIRTLNDTYASQNKQQLITDDQLNDLISMIDKYLDYIKKGQDTGEYQTNLQVTIERLQNDLINLG